MAMKRNPVTFKEGLMIGSSILILMMGFPLIVLAFFTLRIALLAAVVAAAVVGCVAYVLSPAARDWLETQAAQQFSYNGLRLATNVVVHPNHSWARIESDDVIVGADDFVQATLGPVEEVQLPRVGSRIEQGASVFSLRRGNRTVDVRAPMSGIVLNCNDELLQRPQLVNEEPFTRGWAVRMQGDNVREDRRGLLRGKYARSWFREEIDRLMTTSLAEDMLAPALPDGGALVKELYLQIDEETWKQVKANFFERDVPKCADRSSKS